LLLRTPQLSLIRGNMVRFTLRDGRTSATIRMDMQAGEKINEITGAAKEYWGNDRTVLVKGYMMLDSGSTVGESLGEGDIIEAISDPSAYRVDNYNR